MPTYRWDTFLVSTSPLIIKWGDKNNELNGHHFQHFPALAEMFGTCNANGGRTEWSVYLCSSDSRLGSSKPIWPWILPGSVNYYQGCLAGVTHLLLLATDSLWNPNVHSNAHHNIPLKQNVWRISYLIISEHPPSRRDRERWHSVQITNQCTFQLSKLFDSQLLICPAFGGIGNSALANHCTCFSMYLSPPWNAAL